MLMRLVIVADAGNAIQLATEFRFTAWSWVPTLLNILVSESGSWRRIVRCNVALVVLDVVIVIVVTFHDGLKGGWTVDELGHVGSKGHVVSSGVSGVDRLV
jgi:hypothetical protein